MGRRNLGKVALIEENKRLRKEVFEYMEEHNIDAFIYKMYKVIKGNKRITIKKLKNIADKFSYIQPIPQTIKKKIQRIIDLEDFRRIYYDKKKKKE